MAADCIRNRIEIYLATGDADERYFMERDGMLYVKASGTFIANWLMCDRSTARKALAKLHKADVLDRAYLSGRQNGAWYAFKLAFIKGALDFFDTGVKRRLILASKEDESVAPAGDISPTGEDIVPTSGEDNIPTGEDIVPTCEDNIPTGPIYNTNNTNHHLRTGARAREGDGFFDDGFLGERDAPFRSEIAEVLRDYPDEDPVALVKDQLGWKTCRAATKKQIRSLCYKHGFVIFAAAVVMTASEKSVKSPIAFIGKVCERLESQRVDNERRRRKMPFNTPPPQPKRCSSGKSVSEILGGPVDDVKTWLAQ